MCVTTTHLVRREIYDLKQAVLCCMFFKIHGPDLRTMLYQGTETQNNLA